MALFGKILAAVISKPFVKFNLKQLVFIGFGIMPQGLIDMALIFILLKNGIISSEIYTPFIIMVIISSLVFPIFTKFYIKKYPDIMNMPRNIENNS